MPPAPLIEVWAGVVSGKPIVSPEAKRIVFWLWVTLVVLVLAACERAYR